MKTKDKNKKNPKKLSKPSKPMQDSGKVMNKWVWLALGMVAVTTLLVYLKSTGFSFIDWDDTAYLSNNQDIKNLAWGNIKMFFTKFYVCNYQPLTILMYAMEYKVAGFSAALYHINNIVLHLLNTCLVFLLIKKISPKNAIVALITAAFFAVHPMHVESVAWVAERKDVLYSFFMLLSLIMYTDYIRLHKMKFIIYAFFFFMLSCMSKSAAVIIPLILLLFDYYLNRKWSMKVILEKLPFFLISMLFGIIALYSQKGAVRDYTFTLTIFERISIVSYSFIDYILKSFVPVHLSAIYPYPVKAGETLPFIYFLAPLGLVIISVIIFISRKWGKDIIFGSLFFVISIILVLQIFPVGDAVMADRYSYIPYIGIFFITGKLYEHVLFFSKRYHQGYKNILKALLITIFILFAFIANRRVSIWENEETLFADVIRKFPQTSLAYNNIGCRQLNDFALKTYKLDPEMRNMYLDKADSNFTKAIKYTPSFVLFYLNRGITRFHRGNFNDAIIDFDRYIAAIQNNSEAYNYRGKALGSAGNFQEAIANFDKAIAIDPKNVEAYGNRYIAKYQIRDLKGTISDCEKVLSFNPEDERAKEIKQKAQQESGSQFNRR